MDKEAGNAEAGKKSAARSALSYIEDNMVIGVGSGSTISHFIAALQLVKHKIEGAIPSSSETAAQLKSFSIPIVDLNSVQEVSLYIDGADEINATKQMIK